MLCLDYVDDAVRANSSGSLAGVMVEAYQGASGFIFAPEGWFPRLEQWIRSHDVLFALDEVQSGFGRTGKMFAMEWENLTPDLVALGKGIGSGTPASAVAARGDVIGVLGAGEMSSTMGGNPVACAAVVAVVEIFEKEKLEQNALRIGALMKSRLEQIQEKSPWVGDVRGLGLVMGVELVRTEDQEPLRSHKEMIDVALRWPADRVVGVFGNVSAWRLLVISEDEAVESQTCSKSA